MIDLTTRHDRYGRPREGAVTLGEDPMQLREGDLIADRELCLDVAGKPCEVKDPLKRSLLAAAGTIIPKERVAELGLRSEDGKTAWGEAKAKKAEAKSEETAPAKAQAASKASAKK